ncbi:MAG: hypothetical protein ABIU54_02375 [Candidatus Eisenbacteria bacterium]
MRKIVIVSLSVLTAALLVSTVVMYRNNQATTASLTELQSSEDKARSRYGDAVNAIAEIQDSLAAVSLGEGSLKLFSDKAQGERLLSENRGDEALARIALLKAGISRTKERIAKLESSLSKSGTKVAGLNRMMASLKRTVAEREALVAELTGRVTMLQTQVTGLTAEVAVNQDSIRAQRMALETRRREMGTVYYAFGSKKQLTSAGIVVAKGGVLGLGKTIKPSGVIAPSMFTAIDTDEQQVIMIPAAKATVISAQPSSSYQLTAVDGQIMLRIIDAAQFRAVKHLVIMTA